MRFLVLGLVLLTGVLPAPVFAQPSAAIEGHIVDPAARPLPGATITLTGPLRREAQSDVQGRFTFSNLAAGEYVMTAALNGFSPSAKTVQVQAGATTTLSISLAIAWVEQVVVSASRTGDRDVQTTAMSVNALQGDELARTHAQSLADVAGMAPSVTFSQHTGLGQLSIRGIGTNVVFAGSDPSATVYLDGVYLARPAMVLGDFLDLDRVEIMRGPQGTLYGRNAVGGALALVTRAPSATREAAAQITAGTLGTVRFDARASGPVLRDRVRGSIAIARSRSDGFVTDVAHRDHKLGGQNLTAVRGKLLFLLGPRTDVTLTTDVSHDDAPPLTYAKVIGVKRGFIIDNPADPREIRSSLPALKTQWQHGTSVLVTSRLSNRVTLTSLTARRGVDYDVTLDTDITELDLTRSRVHEIQHQWSQDVTLTGQHGRTRWVSGAFFFADVDRQPTSIQMVPQGVESRLDGTVSSKAQAVFAQSTVSMSRTVSITAGIRHSWERKTIDNRAQLYTLSAQPMPRPGGFSYTDAIDYGAWTPKAGIEVRPRDRTFLYGTATRGFKTGGFNISSPEAGRGYAPEWAWSYEGGVKSETPAGRARANVAAFYTDYTNLQVQTAIRPGVLDISNAAAATIRGVEAEIAARLTTRLHAGGHVAWLDTRYRSYIAVGPGGTMSDAAGHRLSNAPVVSGRVFADWTVVSGARGVVLLHADVRAQSAVYFTPMNDRVEWQRAYRLLDVSAQWWLPNAHWRVEAFARNLTSTAYITGTFNTPIPAYGARPGDPRRIGVQLTAMQ